MISTLQALGYQTIILYLLAGIASFILWTKIPTNHSVEYLVVRILGILLSIEHTTAIRNTREKQHNILFSAIFGAIIGAGPLLFNFHPIVPILILSGAVFGFIAYWMISKPN